MNRRDVLQASALAMGASLSGNGRAATQPDPSVPQPQTGFPISPIEGSNPLAAKIEAFTTVSPDVDASITFYRDVMEMRLADEGTLPADITTAPGAGKAGRRYAILDMPDSVWGKASVRILQAPRGAVANRPAPIRAPWILGCWSWREALGTQPSHTIALQPQARP